MVKWYVMDTSVLPAEIHRGPWSKKKCLEWIQRVSDPKVLGPVAKLVFVVRRK